MGLVNDVFKVPVAVLPVIHVSSPVQAAEETVLALGAGAQGVFLISHEGDDDKLESAALKSFGAARNAGFTDPWIGLNLLGHHPWRAFEWLYERPCYHLSGLWSDASGVHPPNDGGECAFTSLAEARRKGWPVFRPVFFGGIAFKHQPQPENLAAECERMINAGVDVLTTSGPATGKPCDPSKIAAMRTVVGDRAAIAVASGVTAENVPELIHAGVDIILVATGIQREGDFHRMDPHKLTALLSAVQ